MLWKHSQLCAYTHYNHNASCLNTHTRFSNLINTSLKLGIYTSLPHKQAHMGYVWQSRVKLGIFQSHHCTWSVVFAKLSWKWGAHCTTHSRYSFIKKVRVTPAPSRGLAIEHFKCGNVLKICNRIIFDFNMGHHKGRCTGTGDGLQYNSAASCYSLFQELPTT